MTAPLDLDAITAEWLNLCGSCDAGYPTRCTCPSGDPRAVISRLVDEVLRLQIMVADMDDEQARTWRLPSAPGPDITAVRATHTLYGFTLWHRLDAKDWQLTRSDGEGLTICPWQVLLEKFGPLKDATDEVTP